jgi:glucosamine--fructose-6-phosphate aminotransferase (isomerizing)
VVFLGDEEMAVITRTGVSFTDFFGRPVSKATQRVLWDPIMAEKAGYKHFMLKEIFEQPTAARETILGRVSQDSGKVFLEEMKVTDARLRAVEKVTILAWRRGTPGWWASS